MSLMLKTVATICFVAGKSGGHLIPCITKAQQLLQENKNICLFSAGSELDHQIMIKNPEIKHINPLELENMPEQWWKMPWFLCKVGYYFCSACYHLYKIKPQKVVSFGGLVSIPVCFAAKLLGIPIELHELNVEPGRAINLTAKLTKKVHIYFPETERYFPNYETILDQYPIRFTAADKKLDRTKLYEKLDLDPNRKTMLVLGGSQGSVSLNQLIKQFFVENPDLINQIQIIHQTGAQDPENYGDFYKKMGMKSSVCAFYSKLEQFYVISDLVICRSGSGTIFETRFFETPAIVIPHETTSTTHQILNAQSMMRSFPDQFFMTREKDCSIDLLTNKIKLLLKI